MCIDLADVKENIRIGPVYAKIFLLYFENKTKFLKIEIKYSLQIFLLNGS
jgi:hypothetical protein